VRSMRFRGTWTAAAPIAGAMILLAPPLCRGKWRSSTGQFTSANTKGLTAPAAPDAGSGFGDGFHPFTDFGRREKIEPVTASGSDTPAAAATPAGTTSPAVPDIQKPEPPPEAETPRPSEKEEIDPDRAAENFPTLVETYLAKNGDDGRWTVKLGAKTRVLELVRVETKNLKPAGADRYAACAVFRGADGGKPARLEFIADFGGAEWAVVSVKAPTKKTGPCAR
jgi:hypothetical protein